MTDRIFALFTPTRKKPDQSALYAYGFDLFRAASCSWPFADIHVALLVDWYKPDLTRQRYWSDIKKWEIKGKGYESGGKRLTGLSRYEYDDVVYLTSDSQSWGPRVSFIASYSVLFGWTGDPKTSPLLSLNSFSWPEGARKGTFTVIPHERGWVSLGGVPLPAR